MVPSLLTLTNYREFPRFFFRKEMIQAKLNTTHFYNFKAGHLLLLQVEKNDEHLKQGHEIP